MRRLHRAGFVAAAICLTCGTLAPAAFAQFGGGGRGDRQELAKFDADGDHHLNTAERKSAYEALRFQSFNRGSNRGWPPSDPGVRLSPPNVKVYPEAVSLYDATALRTIFLEFEDSNWEDEMAAFYRTDIDIPAKVTVDGKVYKNVGVHFRGNSSFSSVPATYKRSLDLSFDFIDAEQKLYGHKKLNLLNANEDPTFLRGVLFLEVARHYYMAPKANLVRVVINGENWGVYMNIEQFNSDMTTSWYGSGKNDARWKVPGSGGGGGRGALYDLGNNVAAYRSTYEIKSKDDPAQWTALMSMIHVLNRTPSDKLEAALAGVLDVDGALKFLAVDNVFVSSDGFWSKGGDYAIYRDTKGVFHLLPHDVNEYFLASGGRGGSTQLSPLASEADTTKALAYRLFAVPALRERYLRYVREISEKWLDWKTLGPMVRGYDTLIRDDVYKDTKKLFFNEEFASGVSDQPTYDGRIGLRRFVEDRRRALDYFFKP